MTYAGWVEIWNSAVALVGRAPFAIQLAVWLGVVFVAVMCLEGMRVSLLPRRWLVSRMARSPFVIPSEKSVMATSSAQASPRIFEMQEKPSRRPGKPAASDKHSRRNRKKVIAGVRRTKPVKPKITRYPADPVLPPMELVEFATSDIASAPMQDSSATI